MSKLKKDDAAKKLTELLGSIENIKNTAAKEFGIECDYDPKQRKEICRCRPTGQRREVLKELGNIADISDSATPSVNILYEGNSPELNRLRGVARARGLRVETKSIKSKSELGSPKLRRLTLTGDIGQIENEVKRLKKQERL